MPEQARIEEWMLRAVSRLARCTEAERNILPSELHDFPDYSALKEMIRHINAAVFPDFFNRRRGDSRLREYFIGMEVERIFDILCAEIPKGMAFSERAPLGTESDRGREMALAFVDSLPELKRLLLTDVKAIFDNDPAVTDYGEIVLCYPAMRAMLHYRSAHLLLRLGVPLLPRMLTELAHSMTGIDIHPGATIGEYFAIDHGTGVVIGETCVIGNHVTIYQGVTLGAKNFTHDAAGRPVNMPRHPVLEDRVTVYSNASILGRITVGHDSVIGGNVWLTHSVPPGSRILQH